MLDRLGRIVEKVNRVAEKTMAVFIAAMSLILIGNVFTRYVLSFSLTWSAELARYCMVWAAFLGITVLVNRSEHLRVDLVERALSESQKRLLGAFVQLVSMLLFAILAGYGAMLVVQTRGQVAASVPHLPMNLVYAVIPFSGVLMLAGAVINFYRLVRKGRTP